jgi:hypothetical protein
MKLQHTDIIKNGNLKKLKQINVDNILLTQCLFSTKNTYKMMKYFIKRNIDINRECKDVDTGSQYNALTILILRSANIDREEFIKIFKLLMRHKIIYDKSFMIWNCNFENNLDYCNHKKQSNSILKMLIKQYIKDRNNNYIKYIKYNNKLKLYKCVIY